MGYILRNIASGSTISLSDNEWPALLDLALNQGWDPDGTTYDLLLELDLQSDDDCDIEYNTFIYITLNHRFLVWDGSYIEKENQIVSDDDAYYLMKAIENIPAQELIITFLKLGAFRISEEYNS